MVGSRRLMPPDSFLHAPPGVSTRDPSSERRNYLGEKWPVISTENCDFHAYTFGFFYISQICDMGQTALLPFPKEGLLRIFSPWKNWRLRSGLNPWTWVPKNSTLPLDHRSRLGKQHAMRMRLYCYQWPVRFYNVFPHHLIKGTKSRKGY